MKSKKMVLMLLLFFAMFVGLHVFFATTVNAQSLQRPTFTHPQTSSRGGLPYSDVVLRGRNPSRGNLTMTVRNTTTDEVIINRQHITSGDADWSAAIPRNRLTPGHWYRVALHSTRGSQYAWSDPHFVFFVEFERPTFGHPANNSTVPFGNVAVFGRNQSRGQMTISVRDVTNGANGPLIFNNHTIPGSGGAEAWEFLIPQNRLTRGHTYQVAVSSRRGEGIFTSTYWSEPHLRFTVEGNRQPGVEPIEPLTGHRYISNAGDGFATLWREQGYANPVIQIPHGRRVSVDIAQGGWVRATFEGRVGWVERRFVVDVPPIEPLAGYRYISNERDGFATLWREQGYTNAIIQIPHGSRVRAHQAQGGWVNVSFAGHTGWVERGFVRDDSPIDDGGGRINIPNLTFNRARESRITTSRIVLHHTVTSTTATVHCIHNDHRNRRDANGRLWVGIAYNYVIHHDGSIWRGRERWARSAGVWGQSHNSVDIALVGNFHVNGNLATPAQMSSLRWLITDIRREYGNHLGLTNHRAIGVGQGASACPGQYFLRHQWPGLSEWYRNLPGVMALFSPFMMYEDLSYTDLTFDITRPSYFDGSWYLLIDDEYLTWEEARIFAANLGGELASINSVEEQLFVESLIAYGSGGAYWLGASRNTTGEFVWADGEPFTFSNWEQGEPNNAWGIENYVEIIRDSGRWNDLPGDRTLGFVIEWTAAEEDDTSHSPIREWNGNYFQVVNIGMNWYEARAYAESLGGHLATITNQAEHTFIQQLVNAYGTRNAFFLGGYWEEGWARTGPDRSFQWITGETGDFSAWAPGQPDARGASNQAIAFVLHGHPGWDNLWDDLIRHPNVDNPDYVFYIHNLGFIIEWSNP